VSTVEREASSVADDDGRDELFEQNRSLLFRLAYRLLGSASDAEDMVQDAYLRWMFSDRLAIRAPRAWLVKVVTNLCLNRLALARASRERYVGIWLPEPVITEDGTLGPMETAEQRESVSIALLTLLETLTPAERAVFVLRESFAYEHSKIADVLGITEANSRQLLRRARARLGQQQPFAQVRPRHWREVVEAFLDAARSGDVARLELLLAADVIYRGGDGGGKVPVARRPVMGGGRVARLFVKLFAHEDLDGSDASAAVVEVNGEPALVARAGGQVLGVLVFELRNDGRIAELHTLANPDKLAFATAQCKAP
jgi:RNA polymerase sigma factor (sigma-70 family)